MILSFEIKVDFGSIFLTRAYVRYEATRKSATTLWIYFHYIFCIIRACLGADSVVA